TGIAAMRLALVGFLIPFVFVYEPALTMIVGFDAIGFLWAALRLAAAIWLLTTGFAGTDRGRFAPCLRVLRVLLGILVLVPLPIVTIAAAALTAGFVLLDARRSRPQLAM